MGRYSETPLPGYYIMRDLNEDSSLSSWPLFYGDKSVTNGYYCNGAVSGSTMDGHSNEDMYSLKRKIVEHEAVFKNQVCELHRLYRIQRDMMEQVQKKELHKERASVEPSCSSNIHGSQPKEDARKKWHVNDFPLQETGNNRASILGIEITDSPVSCMNQDKDTKPPWFPFKNGSTSRNCEASEIRPSKVRKKFFDLQLPADEYVDVEEDEEITVQIRSKLPTHIPNENPKPFNGSCFLEKTNLTVNGQASLSHPMSLFGFVDLNEPAKNDVAAFDFIGKGENKRAQNKPNGCSAGYTCVDDATSNNRGGFLMKLHSETKIGEKGLLSHVNEAGSSKNNTHSLSQSSHLYKLHTSSSPTTVRASPSHPHFGPEQHRTGNGMRDFQADIHRRDDLKYVHRSHILPYGNNLTPIAPRTPSYSLFSTPSSNGSWVQSGSYSLQSLSKHPLPYSQNEDMKWQKVKASPRLNGGYHESSWSEFKEREYLPLPCFDHLNGNKNHHIASHQLPNRGSGKNSRGSSSRADLKPEIDINSKAVFVENRSSMAENNGLTARPSSLPWLKPNGESRRLEISGESSYFHASSKHLCSKNERVIEDLNRPGSSDCEILTKKDAEKSIQRLMGAPIFGTAVKEIKPWSNISTSTSDERKNTMIDINLECEPEEPIYAEEPITENANRNENGSPSIRGNIDLNSCVSDFEDLPLNSRKNKPTKTRIMINLEAPAALESEDEDHLSIRATEHEDVQMQSEVLKTAADIMMAISSSCPQSNFEADSPPLVDNPLLLFADAIESTIRGESLIRRTDSSDGEDSFEAMTLQLKETKEEDCMPKKSFTALPQPEKVEDAEIAKLPNRPRRGQARRGRQRKDFQRDILPGMTSLSRHEVNEDIQTFGGLMRAMGHQWQSRKNGGARGRRSRGRNTAVAVRNPICTRSMQHHLQQVCNNGGGCVEERRLTGWGRTTRRPRRQQRCQKMGNHLVD